MCVLWGPPGQKPLRSGYLCTGRHMSGDSVLLFNKAASLQTEVWQPMLFFLYMCCYFIFEWMDLHTRVCFIMFYHWWTNVNNARLSVSSLFLHEINPLERSHSSCSCPSNNHIAQLYMWPELITGLFTLTFCRLQSASVFWVQGLEQHCFFPAFKISSGAIKYLY